MFGFRKKLKNREDAHTGENDVIRTRAGDYIRTKGGDYTRDDRIRPENDARQYPDVRKSINDYFRSRLEEYVQTKDDAQTTIEDYVQAIVEDCIRSEFDERHYLLVNPDIKTDPVEHYIRHGWIEGRNPRRDFITTAYLDAHYDVFESGINPFFHYIACGKAEGRSLGTDDVLDSPRLRRQAPRLVQDMTFPLDVEKAEALFVILVPEHNTMSGGIYSFFSIAAAVHNLRHKHNYRVLVMTRPNSANLTYMRQSNFRNCEDVFRFDQIIRCQNAREVYLHIPEYAVAGFMESLSTRTLVYLRSRERLHINILNQNIQLMPERRLFEDLRGIATRLTQSVAHHAYFGQEFADRYDLPTLLLPAYTDLSAYTPIELEEKEKLIIYSPDESACKEAVLNSIKTGLPQYRLVEIRDITFDKYMDLATRCRFSISFGEGFDGYVAQPTYQNGIGFAVYNEDFFPSAKLRDLPNIFSSDDDMIENIVPRIKEFEADPAHYRRVNSFMKSVYDQLYSKADYLMRIEMLVNQQFEVFPSGAPHNIGIGANQN
jgi:hypothetical protein